MVEKSPFVFEEGEAIDVDGVGENEIAFADGKRVVDNGISTVVYEGGTGIGGTTVDATITFDATTESTVYFDSGKVYPAGTYTLTVEKAPSSNIAGYRSNDQSSGEIYCDVSPNGSFDTQYFPCNYPGGGGPHIDYDGNTPKQTAVFTNKSLDAATGGTGSGEITLTSDSKIGVYYQDTFHGDNQGVLLYKLFS